MYSRRLTIMHEQLNDIWYRRQDARSAGRHEEVRLLERELEILEMRALRLAEALARVRRFDAPGRVRTALTRMVDDVFATMERREEAREAGDDREVERLEEVEKAHRAQLHACWCIDPVSRAEGTWTAVTSEKCLPQGMGACFPAMRAADATRIRLMEARARGCPSEIQRLEDEERILDEMSDEIGGCVYSERFYPAGLLPAPAADR